MDLRATLLPAGLALGVGIGIGWFVAPRADEREQPLTAGNTRADPERETAPRLGTEAAFLEAAQVEIAEERRLREAAEVALAETRKKLAALEPAAGEEAGAGASGLRYDYQAFSGTLSQMDWRAAGEAVSKMSPLLAELATAISEGKPIPPSVGQIQKYNGPLVTMALTAQQQGMPGTGTNGAFTHPSMLANLVYSTLREGGLPLSPGQETRLAELADTAVSDDARRLAGYGPDTLALQKIWDETRLKDRFYDGVDALVTDEQRELLHPAALRGRLSFDLFSSGLVWMGVVDARRYQTPEALEAKLITDVMARYAIPAEHLNVVEDAAAEWRAGFPRGYLDQQPDALELRGRLKIDRVRIAAERQLTLMRALIQRLPAGSPAATAVRGEASVAVPLRVP